tara:strand:- start:10561 stop:10791 length:231 start_codon:yes stop_codon:yes gene_type:complete
MHNLYLFFEKNLTVTKTKDFFNIPGNEYNKINSIINSNVNSNVNSVSNENNMNNDLMNNDLMKNELNDFLNKLNSN